MAVRTYLDLGTERRKMAAGSLRSGLSSVLADPFSTESQRKFAKENLKKLKAWEDGIIPLKRSQAPKE